MSLLGAVMGGAAEVRAGARDGISQKWSSTPVILRPTLATKRAHELRRGLGMSSYSDKHKLRNAVYMHTKAAVGDAAQLMIQPVMYSQNICESTVDTQLRGKRACLRRKCVHISSSSASRQESASRGCACELCTQQNKHFKSRKQASSNVDHGRWSLTCRFAAVGPRFRAATVRRSPCLHIDFLSVSFRPVTVPMPRHGDPVPFRPAFSSCSSPPPRSSSRQIVTVFTVPQYRNIGFLCRSAQGSPQRGTIQYCICTDRSAPRFCVYFFLSRPTTLRLLLCTRNGDCPAPRLISSPAPPPSKFRDVGILGRSAPRQLLMCVDTLGIYLLFYLLYDRAIIHADRCVQNARLAFYSKFILFRTTAVT